MTRTRLPRNERGASILELAFVTPVMVLIVMGVLDLSRAYQMQIRLENAAGEGGAYARTNPNAVDCGPDEDSISTRVTNEDDGLADLDDFDIVVLAADGTTVSGCGGEAVGRGERVRIQVSATFDVLTPMVERVVGSEIELTGSSEIEVPR